MALSLVFGILALLLLKLLMELDGRKRLGVCIPLGIVIVGISALIVRDLIVFMAYETARGGQLHASAPSSR